MTRPITTALLGLCMLVLSGCLLEDTRHTLFIEPDGGVTWRVVRDLIRSDKDDIADRYDEEAGLLAAVDGGEEGWSETLSEWGAKEVHAELLRTERPYTVVVRARFPHVEDLLTGLLEDADDELRFSFEEQGSLRTLRILPPPSDDDEPEAADPPHPEDAADPVSELRLVLTQGRFIDAQGFALSEDGAVAVPLEQRDDRERVELLLVWDLEA